MEIFVNMDKRTSSLYGCLSFALHLHYNGVSYYEWLLMYALSYIKGTKYAAVRYSFFVQLVVLDFTWPVYIAQICFSLSFSVISVAVNDTTLMLSYNLGCIFVIHCISGLSDEDIFILETKIVSFLL